MKSKKPKPRYNTANEIRDQIDKYKAKMAKLINDALDYERRGNLMCRKLDTTEDGRFLISQAEKMRRSAFRIQEKKLPYLKQKLAEWITDPLPYILPDRSIER